MSAVTEKPKPPLLYQVVSVKKSKAPEGMGGNNWHCYVIERGPSVVTGLKPGTLKSVTTHAQQIADDLNARSGIKTGLSTTARRGK